MCKSHLFDAHPVRVLVAFLLLAAGTTAVDAAVAPPAPVPQARVIVKFKPWSALLTQQQDASGAPHPVLALGQRLGLSFKEGRQVDARTQVVFQRGLSSKALAAQLAGQSDVEYAVVDHLRQASGMVTPNDAYYAVGPPINTTTDTGGPLVGQWYLRTPDNSTLVSAIDAPAAWALSEGSTAQVVAVLDTGIRPEHPDLQGKIQVGYNMIAEPATSNDGDGRDNDPSDPGDWSTSNQCTDEHGNPLPATNSTWHGTQVAGIIGAATNNSVGMASVGWNVKIMPVRVLGRCGGYDSDIIAGMLWAAGIAVPGLPANPYPAKVINMSLGGSGTCADSAYPSTIQQVLARGVVIVAPGGNYDATENPNGVVEVPANCPGVVAVGGLGHVGTKVGYSAQGSEIAISAPSGNCDGVNVVPCLHPILTLTNTGSQGPVASSYTDSFNYSTGTSFASPMVAATAALMLSVNPSLTPSQILQLLQSTARAFPTQGGSASAPPCSSAAANNECYCIHTSTTSTCGAGMLDVGQAVQAAQAAWTGGDQANIGATPLTPLAGQTVTLDASPSILRSGVTITAYTWTLVDGGGIVAAFQDSGSATSNTATPTVVATGTGHFTVQLHVTLSDSSTLTSSAQQINVIAPLPNPTSSGGGGGGAMQAWPLAGLTLAVAVLWRRRRLAA